MLGSNVFSSRSTRCSLDCMPAPPPPSERLTREPGWMTHARVPNPEELSTDQLRAKNLAKHYARFRQQGPPWVRVLNACRYKCKNGMHLGPDLAWIRTELDAEKGKETAIVEARPALVVASPAAKPIPPLRAPPPPPAQPLALTDPEPPRTQDVAVQTTMTRSWAIGWEYCGSVGDRGLYWWHWPSRSGFFVHSPGQWHRYHWLVSGHPRYYWVMMTSDTVWDDSPGFVEDEFIGFCGSSRSRQSEELSKVMR